LTCYDTRRAPNRRRAPHTGRGSDSLVLIQAGGFYPKFYGIYIYIYIYRICRDFLLLGPITRKTRPCVQTSYSEFCETFESFLGLFQCRRPVGLSASWCVGELACRRIVLSASWSVGELVCRRVVQLPDNTILLKMLIQIRYLSVPADVLCLYRNPLFNKYNSIHLLCLLFTFVKQL